MHHARIGASFPQAAMPCGGTLQTQECTHVSEQLLADQEGMLEISLHSWMLYKSTCFIWITSPREHKASTPHRHTHSHMKTCFPRAKAAEEHQGWSCLLTFEPVAFCRNAVARGQLAGEVPGPAPTHTLIVFSIQSIVSIGCNKFQLNPAAKL